MLLGFDYGRKRIGIAVGQTLTRTARPLRSLPVTRREPDWAALSGILEQWRPSALIVGIPLTMDGAEQPLTREARRFGRKLKQHYGLPVHEVDERLSSQEARRRSPGLRRVDPIAAQIIIESWLGEQGPIDGGGAVPSPGR